MTGHVFIFGEADPTAAARFTAAAVGGSALFLLDQQREDGLEMLISHLSHFVVGAVLHRMRHEHVSRIGAERARLHGRCIDELRGRNPH